MDGSAIDRFSRAFAGRSIRRSALRGGVGVAAAALGAAAAGRRPAAAQDATPGSAGQLGEDGAFLFVQTATSGGFAPNPGAGTPAAAAGGAAYLLTLEGHPGGTIYFSDRPARVFGEAPTQRFLDGLGFGPGNPPNAALVAQTDAGDDIVVLELLTPAYDEGAGSITYGANILAEYQGEGLTHVADQAVDTELPKTFGRASLFIDDCDDITTCYADCQPMYAANICSVMLPVPGGPYGTCWSWSDFECRPCRDYGDLNGLCNRTYSDCNGQCAVA